MREEGGEGRRHKHSSELISVLYFVCVEGGLRPLQKQPQLVVGNKRSGPYQTST